MAGNIGFEPITYRLTADCSAVELISHYYSFWRKWRDSNPRALTGKRFSRPPRYSHFDTLPCGGLVGS